MPWSIVGITDKRRRCELDNTEEIKEKIVASYKRGVCDKNGDTISKEKRGMSGQGSAFHNGHCNETYRKNYDLINWSASRG